MRKIDSPVYMVLSHLVDRKYLFFGVGLRETTRYQNFTLRADRPESEWRIVEVRCPVCDQELLVTVDSADLARSRRRARLATALAAAAVAVLSVLLTFGIESVSGPTPIGSPLGVALLLGFLLGGLVAGVAGYLWWNQEGVRLSAGVGEKDGVHSLEVTVPLLPGMF